MNESEEYFKCVQQCAEMASDVEARKLASVHGLTVLNVMWEDTGRYKNSAVGPNISDVTIQVSQKVGVRAGQPTYKNTCMPAIRFPNFADKSADIDPAKFFVKVGNHKKGEPIKSISLKEYLENIDKYLSNPDKGKITGPLINDRDTHVLVSAQACFLPVPKTRTAKFNPVIFNYQSTSEEPAVLVILATREGTSATIIDNKRDPVEGAASHGQRLFHNHEGERAPLTAERWKEVKAREDAQEALGHAGPRTQEAGCDLMLLIQIPLKQKEYERRGFMQNMSNMAMPGVMYAMSAGAAFAAPSEERSRGLMRSKGISDVDKAVLGHGEVEGPFTELDGKTIERDTRFPIRATVQFYKATSNGVVNAEDLKSIAETIEKVYKQADWVGSLVTEGETTRPTEHGGARKEPPHWWADFFARHQANTGEKPEAMMAKLKELFGEEKAVALTEEELQRVVRSGRLSSNVAA